MNERRQNRTDTKSLRARFGSVDLFCKHSRRNVQEETVSPPVLTGSGSSQLVRTRLSGACCFIRTRGGSAHLTDRCADGESKKVFIFPYDLKLQHFSCFYYRLLLILANTNTLIYLKLNNYLSTPVKARLPSINKNLIFNVNQTVLEI